MYILTHTHARAHTHTHIYYTKRVCNEKDRHKARLTYTDRQTDGQRDGDTHTHTHGETIIYITNQHHSCIKHYSSFSTFIFL